MLKTILSASRDPHEVLENFSQEQRDYYNSWEEDWSRRVAELARNGGHENLCDDHVSAANIHAIDATSGA